LRKCFWFGTQHFAQFLRSPSRGSQFSPQSWGDSGTYLSGGGWAASSPMSHREFILEWSAAGSIDDAMAVQAFRDGAYSANPGDLIYFHDPLSYERNILPKAWAQPGLLAETLGVDTAFSATSAGSGYPGHALRLPAGYRDDFVPDGPGRGVVYQLVPPGYDVLAYVPFGAIRAHLPDGSYADPELLSGSGWHRISDARGFLLYFVNPQSRSVSVRVARAVLVPQGAPGPDDPFQWHPGMGHSGCRFVGDPTYVPTGPFSGGMASFAVTLKEVGDWL